MNLNLREIVFNNLVATYYQNTCIPLNDAVIIPHICALRTYKKKNNNNSSRSKNIRSLVMLRLLSFSPLCDYTLSSQEPNVYSKTQQNFA